MLIAVKNIKLKTPTGIVDLKPGDAFKGKNPDSLILAKIAEPVSQNHFKTLFNHLTERLRQRDYTPEEIEKLQALAFQMDAAWEALDYPRFKRVIDEMLAITEPVRPCYPCGGREFWRSEWKTTCGRCHPPADPDDVIEWIRGMA